MVSHLLQIVLKMADDNKLEVTSFRRDRIRSIERQLDGGKITPDEAVAQVASEFGYQFGRDAKDALRRSLR